MGKLDEQFFKAKDFNGYLSYLKAKKQRSDRMIWWFVLAEVAAIFLLMGFLWGVINTTTQYAVVDKGAIACTAAGMEPMTEHGTYLSMTGNCLDENKNVHRVFILENNRAIIAK